VGGLSILWILTTVILENFFSTKWTIMTSYRAIGSNKEGFLTNVYRPHLPLENTFFLKNLEGLKEITQDKRWILGVDFNIILSLEEKREGIL
jgi:hypothetical protein